jgi:signal transduction histidine kinase
MCPDVCGSLVGIMAKFYASGDAEQAFDTWGGHHGWNRSGTRPVAYARRRAGGGVVFLRTSDDLTRRTLDVDSFQGLLDNLALARKVRGIAVTDARSTVLFSTDREQIGSRWLDPPPEAQLLMVSEPFPLGGDTPGTIRIALTTDDARQVLGTAGRNLSVLTLAASLVGVAGLLSVFSIERRHHARAETLREALHQHDRLADLGRMTATVAHEIRNPLNALGLTAQRLARMSSVDGSRDDVQELSSLVRQEVARLDRTVDAFLNLAKPPPTSRIAFDLNELARAVAGLYAAEAEQSGVRLLHEPSPEPLEMDGDPDRLHQALSNLVRNAIESSPRAGSVRTTARKEGTIAVLRVEDTGQGFSVDALEHATAAFFTTKTQGMGLGLTLADRVAKDHGGALAMGNTERGGAWVELRIPLRGEPHR